MSGAPEQFRQAVAALKLLKPRAEIALTEVTGPKKLAPWSYAISAEADGPAGELASGRLILLHDPDNEQAWGGALRVVVYVQAELDAEFTDDPLLPAVTWSWLTDALAESGAHWVALGGTVTRTSSARFGDIAGPTRTDDVQLRASWTAQDTALAAHGEAFCTLLSSTVGLPPAGVVLLGQHKGT